MVVMIPNKVVRFFMAHGVQRGQKSLVVVLPL